MSFDGPAPSPRSDPRSRQRARPHQGEPWQQGVAPCSLPLPPSLPSASRRQALRGLAEGLAVATLAGLSSEVRANVGAPIKSNLRINCGDCGRSSPRRWGQPSRCAANTRAWRRLAELSPWTRTLRPSAQPQPGAELGTRQRAGLQAIIIQEDSASPPGAAGLGPWRYRGPSWPLRCRAQSQRPAEASRESWRSAVGPLPALRPADAGRRRRRH